MKQNYEKRLKNPNIHIFHWVVTSFFDKFAITNKIKGLT